MKARLILLTILSLFAFCACDKSQVVSRDISFSVSIDDEYAFTKTEYADVVGYRQRIAWLEGDDINISSPEALLPSGATTTYIVEGAAPVSPAISRATIKPQAKGGGLKWGTGTHSFFGVYPASAAGATAMQAYIPSSQSGAPDMSYAYMFAKKTGVAAGASSVNLQFYPQFTAFEITISNGENNAVTVSKIILRSNAEALHGSFSLDYNTQNLSLPSDISSEIEVDLGSGSVVGINNPLTVTILAVPNRFTNLQLEVRGPSLGARTMDLKSKYGNPIAYPACQKHIIKGIRLPTITSLEGLIWDPGI